MAFFSRKKNKKKNENTSVADQGQGADDAASQAAPTQKTRTNKRGRASKSANDAVFQNPPVELKASSNESLSEKLAKVAPTPEKVSQNTPEDAMAHQFAELRRVVRESEAREQAEQEVTSKAKPLTVRSAAVALSEDSDEDSRKMSRRAKRREDKSAAKRETRREKSEKSGGMFRRKKSVENVGADEPLALGEKERIDEDHLKVAAVVEARKIGRDPLEEKVLREELDQGDPAFSAARSERVASETLQERPIETDELAASLVPEEDPTRPIELDEPIDPAANPIELSEPAKAIEKEIPPTNIPVESLHLRLPAHWLGLWVSEDGRSFYLEDAGRGSYLVTALPDPMSNCHFGPDFPELETWRMPSAFVREPVGDIVADRLSIETVPGLPPEFLSPLVFLYFLVDVGDSESEGNRFAEPEDHVEDIYIATDFEPGTANPWGDGEIPWLGGSGTYYKAPDKLDDYVLRRMENQEPRNNPE